MRADLHETGSTRFFDGLTRRAAVIGGAASIAALATRSVSAQVATPVPEASPAAAVPVSLLFVQYAGLTTLTPGSTDVHTLTMTGVRPQTIYFSDRPNRIAGAEPTASFVDGFATMFADSAPNASLVGHLESGGHQEEAVVLTLLSATYDVAAGTLTYEVTLLDAELITDRAFEQEPLTVLDAPREYAEASLFIDSVDYDGDTDGDGLSGRDEEVYGTDPLNPDTDRDAVSDGDEIVSGTDPMTWDTDGDGRSDGGDADPDRDHDRLDDDEEINIYETDPDNPDTDGDGLEDGEELFFATDPLLWDTDGDGISDFEDLAD